jgi:excisionase family DNA binding protein
MEERHLSLSEAADALNISERTAYRWIKSGKLRAYKPGRDYWIPESAIKEAVEESLVRPKAPAPSPEQQSFNHLLEDERRLRYLRAWRAFVHNLARRWEQQPPKTEAEITPHFEALTAVVEQGVFEPREASASEGHELMLLTVGFERLNEIANQVEQDEERDAVVRDIREKLSA